MSQFNLFYMVSILLSCDIIKLVFVHFDRFLLSMSTNMVGITISIK